VLPSILVINWRRGTHDAEEIIFRDDDLDVGIQLSSASRKTIPCETTSIRVVVKPTAVGLGSRFLPRHAFVDEERGATEVKPGNAAKVPQPAGTKRRRVPLHRCGSVGHDQHHR